MSARSESPERSSTWTYYAVFLALLLLLAATIVIDQFPLGAANTLLALAISAAKAVLILLFFMHLHGAKRLIQVTSIAALLWLAFAVTLTMGDYATRDWEAPPMQQPPTSGVQLP